MERSSVGLRGVGWALGQASLLGVRSLDESKEPWRERLAELGPPPTSQTLAAHISPDATDAEPSLPQEPRRLWCIVETQVPGSAVLPLISDLKAFPRRSLESNKPGGLDCLYTSWNLSCLTLCWPRQPFRRLAIRSFMCLSMYSFIQQMFVEYLL